MNKEDIKSAISQLLNSNEITTEKALQGFQLSLALCDISAAINFQDRYLSLINEYLLEIALHIDEASYLGEFYRYKNIFDQESCCKTLFLAIVLHVSKSSEVSKELLDMLHDNYYQDIDELKRYEGLNSDELQAFWHEHLQKYSDHRIYARIATVGESTDDINVAKNALNALPSYKIYLKNQVESNIAVLLANTNTQEAIHIATTIQSGYFGAQAKYRLAKIISKTDANLAQTIIQKMPIQYHYGLKAYAAAQLQDLKTIQHLIQEIKEEYEEDTCDEIFIELGLSIASTYPKLAYSFLDELSASADYLQVESECAVAMVKEDQDKALEILTNIDVEAFASSSIAQIMKKHDDPKLFAKLEEIADSFENVSARWEAYCTINKKHPLTFEKLYDTASLVMPYWHINFHEDGLYEYCERYLLV